MHSLKSLLARSYRSAFTLTELLVGIAVMAIILGITFSGGPAAIMKLSLSDNTYRIELLIREVQLQGSAINSLNGTIGGAGVFFNIATSSDVLKFKDKVDAVGQNAIGVGNGLYDTSPVDEKESRLFITNSHSIGKLCVATSTVSTTSIMCNAQNIPPITTLTIVFERPKQSAHIYINGTTTTDFVFGCIQVDSKRSPEPGYVKSILVYRSGMILKKQIPCN
jgi:prepilin-type N-terminal cleavage/methylation domain-containing protein